MNGEYLVKLVEILHIAEFVVKNDFGDNEVENAFKEIAKLVGSGAAVVGMPVVPAKVIPHDEPAAEVPRKNGCFSLCGGVFPIRRANTEAGTMEHVWIDGRRFTMEVVVTETVDGITKECEFTIRDNGQIKISGRFYGGKSNANKVAHKALKTYIKQLTGASKFHSRGGFLKQALKRLMEQRGKDSAAPVEEEANQA